ncbi:hypothetical protein GRX03_12580 [Halovenus sp. WSH3]|uniref:Uncharacterized protein n=1 Tax=Halovenus carboxidivorans TaxID=2692199 RepID=A0A6B0T689_9EURY|nr:hypothetical protein [Halovenus carboxidivorans]MXR52437.1 hypothetical protein [Halovenus carboxidivorans]
MLARWLSTVVLAFGAAVGFVVSYALPVRWTRGPEARWWESLRRVSSRSFGLVDENGGPRPITDGEYAGTLDYSLAETERLLYGEGFIRNPMARLKTLDGRPEDGSWVYRESPLAPRQLHLMLFENGDGTTDVYAHAELSSVNPLCGPAHFRGDGQSVSAGVERAREWLPLDTSAVTTTPPEGSWDS